MNIGPENSSPESFLAAQKPAPTPAKRTMCVATKPHRALIGGTLTQEVDADLFDPQKRLRRLGWPTYQGFFSQRSPRLFCSHQLQQSHSSLHLIGLV